jgi:hypothetical protein
MRKHLKIKVHVLLLMLFFAFKMDGYWMILMTAVEREGERESEWEWVSEWVCVWEREGDGDRDLLAHKLCCRVDTRKQLIEILVVVLAQHFLEDVEEHPDVDDPVELGHEFIHMHLDRIATQRNHHGGKRERKSLAPHLPSRLSMPWHNQDIEDDGLLEARRRAQVRCDAGKSSDMGGSEGVRVQM